MLLSISATAQNKYILHLKGVDKDSAQLVNGLGIETEFVSRFACVGYVTQLPALMQSRGYVTFSIDSIRYDSLAASMVAFAGQRYLWAALDTKNVEPTLLSAVGYREKSFANKPMDFEQVRFWQNKILDYLENNGHPFAKVQLDSLQITTPATGENADAGLVTAVLKVNQGPAYKIDSISVEGNAKITNSYLQRYLDIPNGSLYSKEKLLRISKKIGELTYVEEEYPAKLTWLGTGSIINLYLKQKKSNQVNILIGFLPNNNQLASKKTLITGEGTLNLKNALGSGETIGLNFQALQVASKRLNLLFQYPFLFKSPIGLDFAFDMFLKDSSFLNVNFQLGAQYNLNSTQSGKVFIQKIQTIVSEGGINEAAVILSRQLPDIMDVSSTSLGIDYDYNNTDYRLNPRKGNEFHITTAIGTKKLKKNNSITELKDPGDPAFNFGSLYDTVKLKTYQLRVRATIARYFPLGNKRSTVKTSVNAGAFQSGNVFRNELFQIGGYKLLRGFDEESQYLSQFAIGTLEYRYLVGQNSFFYVLADGGWGRNASVANKPSYTYISTGMGLAFETRAGIFNLAWAVGKRNDTQFNLRQSKIHFGFVNYF